MRFYRRLLNISFMDDITHEVVCRKIGTFTGTPDLDQETETNVAWSHFKIFWPSEDRCAGHSERKAKKRQT